MQHLEENYYHELKRKIAINSLNQAGFPDTEIEFIFLPHASRRRAEFKILNKDNAYHLAFLGNRSHNKTAIENCIILEPNLQKFLPALNEAINHLSFIAITEAVNLTAIDDKIEVIFTITDTKNKMGEKEIKAELNSMLTNFKAHRIAVVTNGEKVISMVETSPFSINIGGVKVPLPYNSFLQATKYGQELLSDFVLKNNKGCDNILDLFCGIGTYSILLAKNSNVCAADNHELMIKNLQTASSEHKLNLKAVNRNLFTKPLEKEELDKFTSVVINPPRLGAKAQCEEITKSSIQNLVMVSCNPATFARDARILKNSGFKINQVVAVDQFVWSSHLEIAAAFSR